MSIEDPMALLQRLLRERFPTVAEVRRERARPVAPPSPRLYPRRTYCEGEKQ